MSRCESNKLRKSSESIELSESIDSMKRIKDLIN